MSGLEPIQTNYPPELIDDFVSWLIDHGYNYEEVFKSSVKTQHYYFQRFLKDRPDEDNQLELDLDT